MLYVRNKCCSVMYFIAEKEVYWNACHKWACYGYIRYISFYFWNICFFYTYQNDRNIWSINCLVQIYLKVFPRFLKVQFSFFVSEVWIFVFRMICIIEYISSKYLLGDSISWNSYEGAFFCQSWIKKKIFLLYIFIICIVKILSQYHSEG